jgi:hypothetical protein
VGVDIDVGVDMNDERDTNDNVEVAGWCFGACLAIAAVGMLGWQIMEMFR